jgi:hypothetical protein
VIYGKHQLEYGRPSDKKQKGSPGITELNIYIVGGWFARILEEHKAKTVG